MGFILLHLSLFFRNEEGRNAQRVDNYEKVKRHIAATGKPVNLLPIVYVDDIVFGGNQGHTTRFKEAIQNEFKVKIKQTAEEFIAVQLVQNLSSGETNVHRQKINLKAVEKFKTKGLRNVLHQ